MEQIPKAKLCRHKRSKTLSAVCFYVVAGLISLVVILPFLYLIATSFKTFENAVSEASSLLPSPFIFDNYKLVFTQHGFLRGFAASLLLSTVPAIGIVASSSLVAYGFTRFEVREKEGIFFFLMLSVMIPGQVLQISMYALYVRIGWINSYLPFLIPPFLGGGIMNVFLIRQFFRSTPKALFEAAEIDGAGELRIFLTIAMPLSLPVLIMVGVNSFVGGWNDFMTPLLYLGAREDLQPLALLMYNLYDRTKIGDTKQWNIISAASLLTMLPLIILFFCSQRYFIEGISLSGIKE